MYQLTESLKKEKQVKILLNLH